MQRDRALLLFAVFAFPGLNVACSHRSVQAAGPAPTAFGTAIVESSGGKQISGAGTVLPQPLVVQVNDEQGNGVANAPVTISGPAGVTFDPANGITDSSGQFTTNVTLGGMAGRYELVASTTSKAQKKIELKIEEIALDYQRRLGELLSEKYCARCHNPESTPERVSNYDNLETKPHAFTEGDVLNKMSDADLAAIISHGGAALNKSPLMPPYGYTLSKADIQSIIAYIRVVSDPPYQAPGMVYAQK
jgi:mono/diheme cytochrome c family protein